MMEEYHDFGLAANKSLKKRDNTSQKVGQNGADRGFFERAILPGSTNVKFRIFLVLAAIRPYRAIHLVNKSFLHLSPFLTISGTSI